MLMYTVRRILATIPALIAATLFTFFLVDLAGDPLAPLITATPPVPEETIEAMRQRFWITFRLVGFATIASIVLAVFTGVVSAVWPAPRGYATARSCAATRCAPP